MDSLPNGDLIVIRAMGYMDVFRLQRGAIGHVADRCFRDGAVDTSTYRAHSIDFTPAETLSDEAKQLMLQLASK